MRQKRGDQIKEINHFVISKIGNIPKTTLEKNWFNSSFLSIYSGSNILVHEFSIISTKFPTSPTHFIGHFGDDMVNEPTPWDFSTRGCRREPERLPGGCLAAKCQNKTTSIKRQNRTMNSPFMFPWNDKNVYVHKDGELDYFGRCAPCACWEFHRRRHSALERDVNFRSRWDMEMSLRRWHRQPDWFTDGSAGRNAGHCDITAMKRQPRT